MNKQPQFMICLFLLGLIFLQTKAQTWDFQFPADNFSNQALLDLRYLNEKYAGENGFLKLSPDSNSFINSSGKTVRIWGINGAENSKDWNDQQLETFARFLAKIGVNAIRYHGSLHPVSANVPFNQGNPAVINHIQRVVAAMKKEGIYTIISPYYAHKVGEVFAAWNIPGYVGKSVKMSGVIYFHDGLRNAYKQWVTDLFTAPNPYSGIALKDEPAVGVIQVHNEDGLFFHTISNLKPEMAQIARKNFYDWLVKKYSSINMAQSAWGNVSIDGDNPGAGEMGLYIIWEATQNVTGAKHKRLTDQIAFYAETQTSFYKEIMDHYKSMGCKQLINGSNWKAADAIHLLDVERATAGVCDVIALNRYYSPVHTGYKSTPDNSAWRIDPGHYYEGKSVLLAPEKLPINVKQPAKHPVIVTESGWNLPHKYQAEGPFLISAYSSLTGMDGFFWFTAMAPTFDENPYFYWTNLEGGQHPLHRWNASIPGQMAMFPANALIYRLGLIKESETLVNENRTHSSVINRTIPVITEDTGFDPNRDSYVPGPNDTELSGISYLAGKINVQYNSATDEKEISPQLSTLVNFKDKNIKSATAELEWDYQNGICTVNAPSVRGICGFVGIKKNFELGEVKIDTENEYLAMNVVATDKQTIHQSGNILIQTGTIYQPTNWKESTADFKYKNVDYKGFLIENTGQMPWKSQATKATITIANPNISSVKQLDAAGYFLKELAFVRNGDKITIELPSDALYVLLQGEITSDTNIKKNEPSFKVYPNPAKKFINIVANLTEVESVKFELKNLLGQTVKSGTVVRSENMPVYTGDLTAGIYIVEIQDKQISKGVHKVVIQ